MYTYIIEEFIPGENLLEYRSNISNISEKEVINIGIQLCELIDYLHSNKTPLLYLDLKPTNIIINNNKIKLIDFGSARYLDGNKSLNEYYGTRGYAAPELYEGGIVDETADIYGIGIILYVLFTGKEINKEEKIINVDFQEGISKKLKKVINKCINHNSSFRYPTVKKLQEELKNIYKNQKEIKCLKKTIAVAGTQERVGVTHLSLQIAQYLKLHKKVCLYEELNSSNDVKKIYERHGNYNHNEDIYNIKGIIMKPFGSKVDISDEKYNYIIKDFSILREDNMEEFLKCDIRILILGTKEWEISESEKKLSLLTDYTNIRFVFNYIDGKTFKYMCRNMKRCECYRMPYEPNIFYISKKDKIIDFISEIIE